MSTATAATATVNRYETFASAWEAEVVRQTSFRITRSEQGHPNAPWGWREYGEEVFFTVPDRIWFELPADEAAEWVWEDGTVCLDEVGPWITPLHFDEWRDGAHVDSCKLVERTDLGDGYVRLVLDISIAE